MRASSALRDRLIEGVQAAVPDAVLRGIVVAVGLYAAGYLFLTR